MEMGAEWVEEMDAWWEKGWSLRGRGWMVLRRGWCQGGVVDDPHSVSFRSDELRNRMREVECGLTWKTG
jgi:hypothetical protein